MLYVAARAPPARSTERATVDVDMNFMGKQRESKKEEHETRTQKSRRGYLTNSGRARWLFYTAQRKGESSQGCSLLKEICGTVGYVVVMKWRIAL